MAALDPAVRQGSDLRDGGRPSPRTNEGHSPLQVNVPCLLRFDGSRVSSIGQSVLAPKENQPAGQASA
jgi:hypothetical protein